MAIDKTDHLPGVHFDPSSSASIKCGFWGSRKITSYLSVSQNKDALQDRVQIAAKALEADEFSKQEESLSKTKSLSFFSFRRTVPLQIKDSKTGEIHRLEMNISNAARELGVSRKAVFNAVKSGTFEQLLNLSTRTKINELYAETKAHGLKISKDDLTSLVLSIEQHREEYTEEARKSKEGGVYKRASKDFSRGVQFNKDGSVFIHFNKKRLGDVSKGSGTYKRVRLAINFDTKEMLAVARIHKSFSGKKKDDEEKEIQEEFSMLQEFHGREGIAQATQMITANGKCAKKFFMQPLYSRGDLSTAISKNRLSKMEKLKVALGLLKGAAALQEKKIIHRDLKPQNILLDEKGNPYIADFGLAIELESDACRDFAGTTKYFSPEYSDLTFKIMEIEIRLRSLKTQKERLSKESKPTGNVDSAIERYNQQLAALENKLSKVTNFKHDAWALGAIIYEMIKKEQPSNYVSKDVMSFPKTKADADPLTHLAYELLRGDPTERLSAEKALTKYGPILEKLLGSSTS